MYKQLNVNPHSAIDSVHQQEKCQAESSKCTYIHKQQHYTQAK